MCLCRISCFDVNYSFVSLLSGITIKDSAVSSSPGVRRRLPFSKFLSSEPVWLSKAEILKSLPGKGRRKLR